jgi:hypothetical protein
MFPGTVAPENLVILFVFRQLKFALILAGPVEMGSLALTVCIVQAAPQADGRNARKKR